MEELEIEEMVGRMQFASVLFDVAASSSNKAPFSAMAPLPFIRIARWIVPVDLLDIIRAYYPYFG